MAVGKKLTDEEAATLEDLMRDADLAIPFDCAGSRVQFAVPGWFVFPKGSLTPHDIEAPS